MLAVLVKIKRVVAVSMCCLALTSCGTKSSGSSSGPASTQPTVYAPNKPDINHNQNGPVKVPPAEIPQPPGQEVVKVRAVFSIPLTIGPGPMPKLNAMDQALSMNLDSKKTVSSSIVTALDAHTMMGVEDHLTNLDPTGFGLWELGSVPVTDLFDNNLAVCGVSGNQQCRMALLRMYVVDLDDIPFFAGLPDERYLPFFSPIGIGASCATVLKSIPIAITQHTVRLIDFYPYVPPYRIRVDLTGQPAGTRSVTLVLEYVLAW